METVNILDFARYLGLSMWAQNIKASPLRLQKLLYYSQAWHLVFFGRENQLFDTAPEAWVNGPVYPSVYQKYKGRTVNMCDGLTLESLESSDEELLSDIKALEVKMNLTEKQVRLFSNVVSLYGTKQQNQLILLTHCEKPWCEARGDLMPYEASAKPISLDTMFQYYKERHDRRKQQNG